MNKKIILIGIFVFLLISMILSISSLILVTTRNTESVTESKALITDEHGADKDAKDDDFLSNNISSCTPVKSYCFGVIRENEARVLFDYVIPTGNIHVITSVSITSTDCAGFNLVVETNEEIPYFAFSVTNNFI